SGKQLQYSGWSWERHLTSAPTPPPPVTAQPAVPLLAPLFAPPLPDAPPVSLRGGPDPLPSEEQAIGTKTARMARMNEASIQVGEIAVARSFGPGGVRSFANRRSAATPAR